MYVIELRNIRFNFSEHICERGINVTSYFPLFPLLLANQYRMAVGICFRQTDPSPYAYMQYAGAIFSELLGVQRPLQIAVSIPPFINPVGNEAIESLRRLNILFWE